MKIIIGPQTYQVVFSDDVEIDGEPAFGYIDQQTSKIFIDDRATDTRQQVTLLHEVIHAIMFENGLHELLGPEHAEMATQVLAHNLLTALHQNPTLASYLNLSGQPGWTAKVTEYPK